MIIKKSYCENDYIIMEVMNITYDVDTKRTNLIGKLIKQNGCDDFLEFEELVLRMNEDVEVIEQ